MFAPKHVVTLKQEVPPNVCDMLVLSEVDANLPNRISWPRTFVSKLTLVLRKT
ncbi:hypothetical protein PGIGA_G00040240 [Pangasianodon gigas]|uniref:Uncharacterized protein n=1 Tax=Pangasianodon gigas TaxID=30993 RepID=A0ACC5X206_PANGG|nr:hypothetical protein [Pangasianodon gigas]